MFLWVLFRSPRRSFSFTVWPHNKCVIPVIKPAERLFISPFNSHHFKILLEEVGSNRIAGTHIHTISLLAEVSNEIEKEC
jgi:hypothetical protein